MLFRKSCLTFRKSVRKNVVYDHPAHNDHPDHKQAEPGTHNCKAFELNTPKDYTRSSPCSLQFCQLFLLVLLLQGIDESLQI